MLKRYRGQPLHERIDALPTYAQLPIASRYPANAAWGVFGNADNLGTINLLTPERVRGAAQLARRGAVFALNWDLELPDPPVLGRGRLRHEILNVGWATDDHYDNFYPQGSSQWDALCHIDHPEFGLYNHRDIKDVPGQPGNPNGMENLARRGLAGRFVLIDTPRYRLASGRPFDPAAVEQVTVVELDRILEAQRIQLEVGDILLIRFG